MAYLSAAEGRKNAAIRDQKPQKIWEKRGTLISITSDLLVSNDIVSQRDVIHSILAVAAKVRKLFF